MSDKAETKKTSILTRLEIDIKSGQTAAHSL